MLHQLSGERAQKQERGVERGPVKASDRQKLQIQGWTELDPEEQRMAIQMERSLCAMPERRGLQSDGLQGRGGGEGVGKPYLIEQTLNLILQMIKSNPGARGGGPSWRRAAPDGRGWGFLAGCEPTGGQMEGTSPGIRAQYCPVGVIGSE